MNRMKWIKALTVTLLVLIVCMIGTVAYAIVQYKDIRNNPLKQLVSEPDPTASGIVNDNLSEIVVGGKTYVEKPGMVNLLFLGIDIMDSRGGAKLGYRSDMIMVCAVDTVENKATLISIPRDTRAEVTKLNKEGKIVATESNRINTAFAYGFDLEKYSWLNSMYCIKNFLNCDELFDIDISYYAGIDIDGISEIADALGGVTVTLDMDFPGLGEQGEEITLKGDDAKAYVRTRHGVGGDLKRAYRQQQFMLAIARKVQSMGAVSAIPKIYDKVIQYVTTNLNMDQILSFATILDKLNIDEIEHVTIPTSTDKENPNFLAADEDGLKDIMLSTYYTEK